MRKIVHFVKEYDPKPKLLCGCKDGFIQFNNEPITCKRCIKSLRASKAKFKEEPVYYHENQKDLFAPVSRFKMFKFKVRRVVALAIGWFKSHFRSKATNGFGTTVYRAPVGTNMLVINAIGAGGGGGGHGKEHVMKYGETIHFVPDTHDREAAIMANAGERFADQTKENALKAMGLKGWEK